MAGDWIQMDLDLEDKPEFMRLVDLTDEAEELILGRLFRLWALVDKATDNGLLKGLSLQSLARKLGGTPEFWQHLTDEAVAWLTVTDEGIVIPGYDKRFSQSGKRRINEARRKSALRRKVSANCPQESGHIADLKKRREEESKEEKRKEQETKEGAPDGGSLGDFAWNEVPQSGENTPRFDPARETPPFDSDAFRQAWREWITHRVEIGKRLTSTAVQKQFAMFLEMGELRAIATINHTIANGWTGLREPTPSIGIPQRNTSSLPSMAEILAMDEAEIGKHATASSQTLRSAER